MQVTRHERGAVLVEMSLFSTFLVLILFGIVEFGLYIGQVNDVAEAVKSATRAGAQTDTAPVPDSTILSFINNSSSKLGGDVSTVVIFRANSSDGKPDPSCFTTTSAAHACNRYTVADVGLSASALSVRPEAQGWPTSSRSPGTDYLGVAIKAQHHFLTPLFGATADFGDQATILIERTPQTGTSQSGFTTGVADPPNYVNIPQVPFTNTGTGCSTCTTSNGPL